MIGVPSAWMIELLMASLTKRWLESKITVADRLHHLEHLADCRDQYGPDVVVAIGPSDNTTHGDRRRGTEAQHRPGHHGSAFFAVLERAEVMADLLRLNPSLARAAGLCAGRKAA